MTTVQNLSPFRLLVFAMALALSGTAVSTQSEKQLIRTTIANNTGAQSIATDPEAELQSGISLTRQGKFKEAIPHFLAAQGKVTEEYAEDFNLALCYVATGQNKPAIQVLGAMRIGGHETAEVDNLLAQAYIGEKQNAEALEAFQQAAKLTPQNEKLYLFIADACMQKKSYDLGLKVLDKGIQNLPNSAPLHYERGLFQTQLERYDLAKADYASTEKLASGSEFAYLAEAQEDLLEGNIAEAVRATRAGVERYPDNYILLQLLGIALIHSGVAPGQPEFEEAVRSLEKSVAQHPEYARSQTALGKLYLMENHVDEAITHLEAARQLDPDDTSVYSHLATAYRRKGEPEEAQRMLAILARLNDAEAGKIRAGPPARAGSSGSPE